MLEHSEKAIVLDGQKPASSAQTPRMRNRQVIGLDAIRGLAAVMG